MAELISGTDTRYLVSQVRDYLGEAYRAADSNHETIELLGASFHPDEATIFGAVDQAYVDRELEWYQSQSLSVNDIPGRTPAIWTAISSSHGEINSNYGYLLFSSENGLQYDAVLTALTENPTTRRAVAIYTRPTMHDDWSRDGMSDFVCTNAVHYEIRDDLLHLVVQMRSQDAVFGYKNDLAWQLWVRESLLDDLHLAGMNVEAGHIIWQVASLHVYRRHFYLLHHFVETGESWISKTQFASLYPSMTRLLDD